MDDATAESAQSDSDPTPLPAAPTRIRPNSKFDHAIHAIITDFDQDPQRSYTISQLHQRYQIKRRRLYDVINVFSAIGCVTRHGAQEIVWHGRDRIFPEMLKYKQTSGLANGSLTLAALFPSSPAIGLPALTVSFLLLFPALQVNVIDLRKASAFFSRDGGKYKTILCKLYQIALILGALNITERSSNVCEIRILPPLLDLLQDVPSFSPFAIPNLLNRPVDQKTVAAQRRAELESSAASRANPESRQALIA
jgi:hypothetical protein